LSGCPGGDSLEDGARVGLRLGSGGDRAGCPRVGPAGLGFRVQRVDTRVVTTRRVIKVQRHSIFRHLENGRKKAYMCIVRTPKTAL
jgi:hypothetical protein